ncbi:Response regulator [hydrothermal vent metagenome]|uniref:Response regulator n=1 Tax=hydrothermal vent metagenome TaxID=652676 RepID=A0A3B1B110_9ZZZZ
MNIPKKSLTTGEIAGLCDVNQRTVIRWIERGQLNAYQLPGRGDNRVQPEDLLTFLQAHGMPVPETLEPPNRRVLIVDDEPSMAKSMVRVLRRAGFDTAVATDGFQAGSLIYSHRPAVMTLDLQMPGVNGFEVLKFVRNTEHLQTQKIVVVSAMPVDELRKALKMGADAVLEKPVDNKKLIETVSHLANIEVLT